MKLSHYEQHIYQKLIRWEREQTEGSPGLLNRWSMKWQKKIDSLVPDVIHQKLSRALEGAVKALVNGVSLIKKRGVRLNRSLLLEEKDRQAKKVIERYKKWAMGEGAGTGMGGFVLSAVDFPALIGIKFKMLQELSAVYGYDLEEKKERLFVIKVFQLAYAGEENRRNIYRELKNWHRVGLKQQKTLESMMDWRSFYEEYRGSLEWRKLLQVIPGMGAVVGAIANRSIVDDLGETALQVYRLRHFQDRYGLFLDEDAPK
ncbi:MAG: EcsC family protein [Bacillaceae bacterium]|nr:EcsC family protein [Bacillaceae bacterium]